MLKWANFTKFYLYVTTKRDPSTCKYEVSNSPGKLKNVTRFQAYICVFI